MVSMAENSLLSKSLRCFKEDVQDFCLSSTITVLDEPPSSLVFYRDYVAKSKPVIIKNATKDWPALKLWSDYGYLKSKIGETDVTVAITPNGYADAINGKHFVTPHYESMKMAKFLDILKGRSPKTIPGVHYIQKQNSNFLDEFGGLHLDAATEIAWASEAFGCSPDAVNFWMGEKGAVTSMHKDPYENLYAVVSGEKHFILHPPTDLPYIPYGLYQSAHYEFARDSREWRVISDEGPPVPWVCVDPLEPDGEAPSQYSLATPLRCTVKAGEMLYLPSLWFHHLRQSHGAIAVNFWYDMEFSVSYCFYKLLENLSQPYLRTLKS